MSDLIDLLLDESDLADDAVLRELLHELEREATAVQPMPSAAVSSLLSPRRARRSSSTRRGVVITSIAVIGALGLGAGAAAASPDARSAIAAGVATIARLLDPGTAATVSVPLVGGDGRGSFGPAEPPPSGEPDSTPSPSGGSTPPPVTGVIPTPAATGDPAPAATSDPQGSGSSSGESEGKGNGNGNQSGHGNGKGNQSGHGNGKGQGNGGPAPTP